MQLRFWSILSQQGSYIMATEWNVFATVACCLLAISLAMAQSNMTNWMTTTTPGSNTTFVTSTNSADNDTVVSNVTQSTTPFTTFPENTSHTQTSESTNNTTPLQNTTTLTTTPGKNTTSFTAPTIQTTAGYTGTPDTTVRTTEYSSNTANTASAEETTTQGVGLNVSEKNMTIVFSAVLGLFGFGFVVFMFNRCRHKFQYLHQPLNNTNDTDVFVADDDILVISGGLYDGHPIYDNAPTAPADNSQFRLEFVH